MLLVLRENPYNVIMPFIDEVRKKYASSSIGFIGARDKVSDLSSKYVKPPLFNNGWLLICSPSVSVGAVRKLNVTNNLLVFTVNSIGQRDKLLEKFSDFNPKYVDNYVLNRDTVIGWIDSELGCGTKIAEKVYKKAAGRLNAVIEAVNILSLLDKVDEQAIRKYVDSRKNVGVNDLVLFMLGVPRKGVALRDVIGVIRDFRFAMSWLLKFLENEFSDYTLVFWYALSGELTPTECHRFFQQCSNKRIISLGEAKLSRMLSLFGTVSLEYVVFLQAQVAKLEPSDKMSICKLVQLVKVSQASVC